MKRVLACGDFHCGHFAGLTPPDWQYVPGWKDVQKQLWNFWAEGIEMFKPFDAAIYNGDLIDGRGERSGSTELIEVDRSVQCAMATACIRLVEAPVNVITFGTPYHTGTDDDWEQRIAQDTGAAIGGHEWLEVGPVVFDCKHKVGNSTIPHGAFTAVAKERLMNVLWAERDGAPKSDVVLRSHIHRFGFCGDSRYLAMTLPALQGLGSKFGVRQCSSVVDFGFVVFDVNEKTGEYEWTPHILRVQPGSPVPVKC